MGGLKSIDNGIGRRGSAAVELTWVNGVLWGAEIAFYVEKY